MSRCADSKGGWSSDEKGCILDLLLGRSVKSIGRNHRTSESAVRRVMREYVDNKLDPELRRNTLAVDLCDRLIMRRAVALGLTAPRESLITIVEKQAPRQTSTDRIETALRNFRNSALPRSARLS